MKLVYQKIIYEYLVLTNNSNIICQSVCQVEMSHEEGYERLMSDCLDVRMKNM